MAKRITGSHRKGHNGEIAMGVAVWPRGRVISVVLALVALVSSPLCICCIAQDAKLSNSGQDALVGKWYIARGIACVVRSKLLVAPQAESEGIEGPFAMRYIEFRPDGTAQDFEGTEYRYSIMQRNKSYILRLHPNHEEKKVSLYFRYKIEDGRLWLAWSILDIEDVNCIPKSFNVLEQEDVAVFILDRGK